MTEHVVAAPNQVVEPDPKTIIGFWVYLMTDCVLFASLFAVYAVLHNNTFGGPSGKDLFNLPYVLTETLILLTSSFTCGMALLAAYRTAKTQVIAWLSVTFILGASFVFMEVSEFARLVHEGNGWQRSGFLSSFFTLVATHGLHISVGLLWMLVLILQVARRGLGANTVRRLTMLSLFWHFLDLIWIFIFSIVYLMGAM
ncbi:MAG TPA: cytochrome o ubiquinol oxidase subunit III [Candidatus Saccharimonadia bacterium]|nr:cytochrome o ubiquinol oxidase subunit III [Candidatus Saccharimonadia bacterium]